MAIYLWLEFVHQMIRCETHEEFQALVESYPDLFAASKETQKQLDEEYAIEIEEMEQERRG